MDKKISFEERRSIQMMMLKEIDAFCRENNIRYSLSFGTLLGAIRHKGYIPWDDDIDIMMPLPDLLRFKNQFKSKNIEYRDVWNDKYYEYSFSRLTHKKSYRKDGAYKSYGIFIDLYIMIGVPDNNQEYEDYFNWIKPVFKRSLFLGLWRARFARRFCFMKRIPGYTYTKRKLAEMFFNHSVNYNTARNYFIVSGAIKEAKERYTYDRDLFASMIDVEFEGGNYKAIADFDYYLELCYGNYMQLPPEEQRVPYHIGEYYFI